MKQSHNKNKESAGGASENSNSSSLRTSKGSDVLKLKEPLLSEVTVIGLSSTAVKKSGTNRKTQLSPESMTEAGRAKETMSVRSKTSE